jgi:ABC-2 type transport system ATP-binding protein
MSTPDLLPIVSASQLAKSYGQNPALKPCTFTIPAGQILGVIGANGAGKSTLLNCLLGLQSFTGALSVLGRDPYRDRAALMQEVCFIADVATLPKWAKVSDLFDWVAEMHPRFDKTKALDRLARSTVPLNARVKTLSKGMTVQAHLAIVLAIDAKLLVLDEPTLGLDIVNRRAFYDAILTEFFDETRTIIVTTHQVEEIEQILTHAMFIRQGEVALYQSLDELGERFLAVDVSEAQKAEALALKPILSRTLLGRTSCVFDGVAREQLLTFGEPRRVGLADLFVAMAN